MNYVWRPGEPTMHVGAGVRWRRPLCGKSPYLRWLRAERNLHPCEDCLAELKRLREIEP